MVHHCLWGLNHLYGPTYQFLPVHVVTAWSPPVCNTWGQQDWKQVSFTHDSLLLAPRTLLYFLLRHQTTCWAAPGGGCAYFPSGTSRLLLCSASASFQLMSSLASDWYGDVMLSLVAGQGRDLLCPNGNVPFILPTGGSVLKARVRSTLRRSTF